METEPSAVTEKAGPSGGQAEPAKLSLPSITGPIGQDDVTKSAKSSEHSRCGAPSWLLWMCRA